MSIVHRIRALEAPDGRLKRFEPRFRGNETERRPLSIETSVHQWMHTASAIDQVEEMLAQARANCRDFVIGHSIDDCDFMKRVEDHRPRRPPFGAGVWALGIRLDPQHRLFGCFALPDWFVVLTKAERAVLDQDPSRWHEQIDACDRIWGELFPGHLRVVADNLESFLTFNVEKCDERW